MEEIKSESNVKTDEKISLHEELNNMNAVLADNLQPEDPATEVSPEEQARADELANAAVNKMMNREQRLAKGREEVETKLKELEDLKLKYQVNLNVIEGHIRNARHVLKQIKQAQRRG